MVCHDSLCRPGYCGAARHTHQHTAQSDITINLPRPGRPPAVSTNTNVSVSLLSDTHLRSPWTQSTRNSNKARLFSVCLFWLNHFREWVCFCLGVVCTCLGSQFPFSSKWRVTLCVSQFLYFPDHDRNIYTLNLITLSGLDSSLYISLENKLFMVWGGLKETYQRNDAQSIRNYSIKWTTKLFFNFLFTEKIEHRQKMSIRNLFNLKVHYEDH